jgi:hypothetical protein
LYHRAESALTTFFRIPNTPNILALAASAVIISSLVRLATVGWLLGAEQGASALANSALLCSINANLSRLVRSDIA